MIALWLHIKVGVIVRNNYFPKSFAPNINVSINKTMKIKNNTLAIEAAPAAIPVKPNMAAIIAITTKMIAHLSII